MCLGGLDRIVGWLKSVYASEASHCVLLKSANASEVSDKQERLSRELPFTEVACDHKVPAGFGIDEF